jgi:hypothetical protein
MTYTDPDTNLYPPDRSSNLLSPELNNINIENVKRIMKPELDKVLSEAKDEISRQIQTDKATLITIFGIFASITSFLAIELQFLKTISDLDQIIGFSCILFALLLGFNIALDYLVKSRIDKEIPKPHICYYAFVFILFGVGFLFISDKKTLQENQNYQKSIEILEK